MTGVQTCALPISQSSGPSLPELEGIDLQQLDLEHIELEDTEGSGWRFYVGLVALIAAGSLLLWFPNSALYRAWGDGGFFVLSLGAVVVGVITGRWLWRWAERAAERYAQKRARQQPHTAREQEPPSAALRWLTLLGVLGGGVALVLGMPSAGFGLGSESTFGWFVAAVGALAVGILAGRWVVMQAQAHAHADKKRQRRPVQAPAWLKWVTLAGLVVAGAGAMLAGTFLQSRGSVGSDAGFGLGSVGFVLGIAAAIWLARRFEETQERLRQQNRAQPRKPSQSTGRDF